MRDTGEQQTRPDVVDWDNYAPDHDEPDHPNHRSQPRAIPDHGQQPRRPRRPTEVVYKRDPNNTYRPADDPYLMSLHDAETSDGLRLGFTNQRQVARLLVKTAKNHAPRLSWRADNAIAEVIEREVLPDARFVAKSLPTDIRPKVLDEFIEVLWGEIALIRQKRSNTKT